jgi:pimeloyl-ACP methyl ester carboxylesterase
MPYVDSKAGKLYCEETGAGSPVVFVHEFAGDHRSWEAQMRFLARHYRCIAFSALGYTPSDVPADEALYDWRGQVERIGAVLDHLKLERAHLVGLSMGAYSALMFGVAHPKRAQSLVVAGCGSGAPKEVRETFRAECEAMAARLEREGMAPVARQYGQGATRVQFQTKDRRGWEEFAAQLAEHSAAGSARTLRQFQALRPSLFDFGKDFAALDVPVLLIIGDEDEPCLETNLFLKRSLPHAGLLVLPNTGHTVNLEEPAAFNAAVADFLAAAERGTWPRRDPRAKSTLIMSMGKD